MPEAVEIRLIDDVRRHEAMLSQGSSRLIVIVQAMIEDIEGALALGWRDYAAFLVRAVVLECAHVRAVQRGGPITWGIEDTSVCPVRHATPDERAAMRRLVEAAAGGADPEGWMPELERFVAETEALMGTDEPLPVLRSPGGLFGAIRLLREEAGVIEAMGLPGVIPTHWIGDPGEEGDQSQQSKGFVF